MSYREPIFEGAEFTADFGEVTLIRGESGVGKSTLLEIISNQKRKQWGEYSISGIDVDQLDKGKQDSLFQNEIIYLKQNEKLFLDYTVEDNLSIFACRHGIKTNSKIIKEILSEVNLAEDISKLKLSRLSSGERQRIQLAIALICNYNILLCDEITNALDEENKIIIMKILKRLAHFYGKMIIIVSHDENFIEESDVVYTVENRKINKIKSSKNIKKNIDLAQNLTGSDTPKKFFNHYLKIKFKRYIGNYIGYFCLITIIVLLTIFGFQSGTQYTGQLKALQNSVDKNQFYLMNLGADSSIVNHYFSPYTLPVSDDVRRELQEDERIKDIKPYLFFNIKDETTTKYENFIISEKSGERELSIDHERLSDYVFPYYSIDSIKTKCEQFIDGKEGLVLPSGIAKLFGIEELTEDITIKMSVYVPTVSYPSIGGKQTISGGYVTVEMIDILYTKKEIVIPVIGILNMEHVTLSSCMGYLNYDYMAELLAESQEQITLGDDQSLWKSNTYAVFFNKKNFDLIYDKVYTIDQNHTMFSVQDNTAQLMSRWTDMEQNVQYYTVILFLCSIVLIVLYSLFAYKKDKPNLIILNKQLLTKNQCFKMFRKELTFLGLLSIIINVILINVEMFICFRWGIFIQGIFMWNQIIYNNVVAVIYTIILVILSQIITLRHVRKDSYD
ncbi:ATP-binding cassette domain-containing protein [Beduini sp.]